MAAPETVRKIGIQIKTTSERFARAVNNFKETAANYWQRKEQTIKRAVILATVATTTSILYAPQQALPEFAFFGAKSAEAKGPGTGDPNDPSSDIYFRGYHIDKTTFNGKKMVFEGGGKFPYQDRFNLFGPYDVKFLPITGDTFAQDMEGNTLRVVAIMEGDKMVGTGTVEYSHGAWHPAPDYFKGDIPLPQNQ